VRQPGLPITKLEAHTSTVLDVAWSPDSSTLASASRDGNIVIWDLQTWQRVHILAGHAGRVTSLAWSPDALRLASTSDDLTVAVC